MSTETYITFLLALMINAVLFGTAAIVILATPALAAKAAALLPVAVAAALILTPPIAAGLAPRMRLRYQRAAQRPRYRR